MIPGLPAVAQDPAVHFRVDLNVEPGNTSPILAALLIGMDQRRRERLAAEAVGAVEGEQDQQEARP